MSVAHSVGLSGNGRWPPEQVQGLGATTEDVLHMDFSYMCSWGLLVKGLCVGSSFRQAVETSSENYWESQLASPRAAIPAC